MTMQRPTLLTLTAGVVVPPAASCDRKTRFHGENIFGSLPPLAFSKTDAMTGTPVTVADFRDKVPLLYFGYALCPGFCPTTLTNLAAALKQLGKQADRMFCSLPSIPIEIHCRC